MDERLSLEGLRYARAVAESTSFTAAARAYGVTQPALSNGIAKLEARLGSRLFDRSPQGATPTSAGERLLPLIARAVAEVDAVLAESRRLAGHGAARGIRLGVSPLISQHLVARAFAAVRELETPRDLVLREANMQELRDGLVAEALDLVLIPSVAPLPRFEHRVIDSEPVVVVESLRSPATPVELADAADKELILVPDTCGLTTFTRQLFESNDLPLRIYPGEAAGYGVLEHWAQLGLGAAILPESKLTSPDVPHRRLSDRGEEVEIFYAAVWPPSSGLAADLAAVVDRLVPADS
jgi:DNA-binding transcriptional LysR family regulator